MKLLSSQGYPFMVDLDSFSFECSNSFRVSEISLYEYVQVLNMYNSDKYNKHLFAFNIIKSHSNLYDFIFQHRFECISLLSALRSYFNTITSIVNNDYQAQHIKVFQVQFHKDITSNDVLVYIDFIPFNDFSVVYLKKWVNSIRVGNSTIFSLRNSKRPRLVFSCLNLSKFSGKTFIF